MRNDYYFDNLDIENFFIEDQKISGDVPNRPGFVNTKPEDSFQKTGFRNDPLMAPIKLNAQPFSYEDDFAFDFLEEPYNADGRLRDKLKAFVESDKGKKILKIAIGGAIAIAFGPQLIAMLGPVLPAMKAALAKNGLAAKGPIEIIKKFSDTQLKLGEGEKKDPKKLVEAIFKFFKAAKDRRAAGTASPLDETVLNVADTTIQKISDGTLSVNQAVEGAGAPEATPGRTKEKTETTTEKKGGIDMKIILIALVAVFFLTKK